MHSTINLTALLINNLMGLVALFITMIGNAWQFKTGRQENRILKFMLLAALAACIIDPLCSITDGQPGVLCYLCVLVGNYILYVLTLLMGPAFVLLVAEHLNYTITDLHKKIAVAAVACCLFVLVLNFIYPLVFSVNEENIYIRGPVFFIYIVVQIAFVIDGILMYRTVRLKGGSLKFFPVWAFITPAIIGVTVQTFVYGVSTIWPFLALSVCGVMSCLQNEKTFRDGLTGLYNRLYLDNLVKKNISNRKVIAMMLDMNGFKIINDLYGHSVGDEALVNMADILRRAVGPMGEVIRYAGDEFIVIAGNCSEESIEEIVGRIRSGMDDFNSSGKNPYRLSASIGYKEVDLSEKSLDEIFSAIDALMYEDKARFYNENPECNRRKNR